MKLQVMSNGFIPPMHHQGMPGKFRETLNCYRRIVVEINDPEAEQAIKDALAAGFKFEGWFEKIIEE